MGSPPGPRCVLIGPGKPHSALHCLFFVLVTSFTKQCPFVAAFIRFVVGEQAIQEDKEAGLMDFLLLLNTYKTIIPIFLNRYSSTLAAAGFQFQLPTIINLSAGQPTQ